MLVHEFLALIAAIIAISVSVFKWRYKFFERLGIDHLHPEIPFGDARELLTGQKTFGEKFAEFYASFKAKGAKVGGIFFGFNPLCIAVDVELVKNIMQNDFQYFMNRGGYFNELDDPLSAHLFAIEDERWKNLRQKLTPTFTSGKMKMMFTTLKDCSAGLKSVIQDSIEIKEAVDIKDILGRFTTDIIGSVAFGIDCNSLEDPNNEFRIHGKRIFEHDVITKIKFLLTLLLPHDLLRFFKMKITEPNCERFFFDVIKKTVDYREKFKIYRPDFMHLLLQLKNRGKVADDGKIIDDSGAKIGKEIRLTFNELAAQAFVFYAAGFETSSSLMTFALFELALNQHVQDQLRNEIIEVLRTFGGELSYEAVVEMKYLEKVLCEALRKYPPLPVLSRRCSADYKIPGSSVIIPRGTNVIISSLGLHRDPEFYPNPENFDPERFDDDEEQTEEDDKAESKNKAPKKRNAFSWIPFGAGPRICIGLRFGMLQSKVGLITLLSNFKFTLNSKTQLPIKYDKRTFILSIEGGVWLDAEELPRNRS